VTGLICDWCGRLRAGHTARGCYVNQLNDSCDGLWERWLRAPIGSFEEAAIRLGVALRVFAITVLGGKRVGPTP
jgi:hypothetical protein